ncbi:hypothetical protein LSH36_224g03034, partial [Paralvinella palmiformis]
YLEDDCQPFYYSNETVKYCGFGTVGHSIYSTRNWLIFKILASEWDANHNYIGFLLYYTAVHDGNSLLVAANGAIAAITVVSVLVGGTCIFFIGYCIYKHQQEKTNRERPRRDA